VNIENSLTCKQCAKTFDLKNATFAENQTLNKKIKSMEYLSSRERQTFAFVQNKLKQMEKLQNEYGKKSNQFTMIVVDHFFNIKNAIDIRRETLLEEIYNINNNNEVIDEETLLQESTELIERIEQAEKTFLRTFTQNLDEVNLEHERNRIFEFLRNTQLNNEDLENLEKDIKSKFVSLGDNLKCFDTFQAILAQNYFKPCANNNRLGELNINLNKIAAKILWGDKKISDLHTEHNITVSSGFYSRFFNRFQMFNTIKFCDLQTGKCLKTLKVKCIFSLKVLKNGDLATAHSNSIKIWDVVMFKLKFTLLHRQRDKGIKCLEQLSNEWLVAGGSYRDGIEIWDLNKRVCIRVISSWLPYDSIDRNTYEIYENTHIYPHNRVTCLQAFEKTIDGNVECFFAAGTSSGFLGIWNVSNGACVKEYRNFRQISNFDSKSQRYIFIIYSLELRSKDELLCSTRNGVYVINLDTFGQPILESSQRM